MITNNLSNQIQIETGEEAQWLLELMEKPFEPNHKLSKALKNHAKFAEENCMNNAEITFYTMWQDRFSDSDDIEVQQKEVNEILAMLRKPRDFNQSL